VTCKYKSKYAEWTKSSLLQQTFVQCGLRAVDKAFIPTHSCDLFSHSYCSFVESGSQIHSHDFWRYIICVYVCIDVYLIDNQNIHENSKNKYIAEAHCKNNLKVQITW